MRLEIFGQFLEKSSPVNFIRIRPMGAELFRAGGQTDGHEEASSRFSQFCERT